jgi:toxin FitB
MYILDTNVISELRVGKANPSPAVLAWARDFRHGQMFITAVTVLELEKGVQLLERKSPPQGGTLRLWLDALKSSFEGRILSFKANTACLCATLHIPNPRPDRDAMIAASALEHRFAIVTRNVNDFHGTGVMVINPWGGDPVSTR